MKKWVLHETDLFRPHEDPDDHWDLACQFALAKKDLIDLRGVLIDYPPRPVMEDPDIIAVSQMGWITGLCVPVGVGQMSADDAPGSGLMLLKRTLEEALEPVTLHIVGSSRDIAQCGLRWPELFREKVGALYLNAGSGLNTEHLEYNVGLDIESYSQIFSLPCPIYWMPCFHDMEDMWNVGEFGTFYRFRQGRLFKDMPDNVLNFFLSMLARKRNCDWIASLDRPVDEREKEYFGGMDRNMWCTGGFLHTAGMTVWTDGTIAPVGERPDCEVFEFVPIEINCGPDGRPDWKAAGEVKDRFIYRVKDKEKYQEAMTIALGKMMAWLWEG